MRFSKLCYSNQPLCFSIRKWKKEWTRCWCSGKPSASSKKGQWPRRSVSWLGSKSAEKLTFLRRWPLFITMSGADTSTRRLLTHSPSLWMRKSRWRAIAISSLVALSYGTHSNLSGEVRSCNACLTTMRPVLPLRHSRAGYICQRPKRNFSRKHYSSLSKSSTRRRVGIIANWNQCSGELRYLKKLRNILKLLK